MYHFRTRLTTSAPARAGNALLIAMVVMGTAALAITISTENAVATQRREVSASHESEVLAALDIVLARRQRQILELAATGRPEDFTTMQANYGVDFVGACEVRWKVEPTWARRTKSDGSEETIENPVPEGATGMPTNSRENPSAFYLYRIAGEARFSNTVEHDAGSANVTDDRVSPGGAVTDIGVKAQGVRYVTTTNESVLKYLLYWAQRGPRGDLELSHGPTAQLIGSIYSGGSVYLGSGTVCNDWGALAPLNGDTVVGPPLTAPNWTSGTAYPVGSVVRLGAVWFQAKDFHTASAANQPGVGASWRAYWEDVTACRIEGYDGVYRLSKQTLYGAFNSFPMASVAPSGFTVNGSYLLTGDTFPGEKLGDPRGVSYLMPLGTGDVFTDTYQGRVINPARVRNPLATRALTLPDNHRRIHVVTAAGLEARAIRGIDESAAVADIGNDSRDTARALNSTSGYVWATDSLLEAAPGFNRQVRSKANGLAESPLAERFKNRPVEPQAIREYDLDGDSTTDEHEYAMPLFIATDGSTTDDPAQRRQNAGNDVDAIEVPGKYLSDTLGSPSFYMGRQTDYRGWRIVDNTGIPVNFEPTNGMGLVIRERPRPHLGYFTPTSIPGPSDPLYMPFAYGHVRSSIWPFTAADVCAEATNTTGNANSNPWASITTAASSQRYATGGSMAFRSAAYAGPNWSGGYTDSGAYQRFPYNFQDNWRFVALGRQQKTTTNGLTATYWNDRPGTATQWLGPFGGRPLVTRTDANISVSWAAAPTGTTGIGADYFSVRWTGFVRPRYSDNYSFIVNRTGGACAVRVWVDDTLMVNDWNHTSTELWSSTRSLTANQDYPIVVEMYNTSGTAALRLDWQSANQVREPIPTTRLFTATRPLGFDWSTFTSAQVRLDSVSIVSSKAGLMLRPGSGLSPVQDGRDPYVAIAYSPERGVYAQVRGERSRTASGTQTGWYIGNGDLDNDANGSFETPLADVTGEITPLPNAATVQRSATLTPLVGSTTFSQSDDATSALPADIGEKRQYIVYTPGTGSPATAPPAIGSWPAGSGTSAISGSNWTSLTISPLKRTVDNPFAVPEGVVDRVWTGPVVLRAQKWPQERVWRRIDVNMLFRLAGLAAPTSDNARFRWNAGDAWPTTWPVQSVDTDDIDSGKYLYLFSDRTGDRTLTGLFSSSNWTVQLNTNSNIDNAGTDHGAFLNRSWTGGTPDTGYVYWFLDANADGKPDGTYDVTTTYGDAKTVYYINAGGVDTRPQVKNGSTLVRVLTQAETLALMDATYGGTHVAVTTLPAYPTVADQAYAAGDPAPSTSAATPIPGFGFSRLSAATTTAATVLTVDNANGHVRPYSVGELLSIHSGTATGTTGTEIVKVTAVNDSTRQVTVVRAQNGTAAVAHPLGALVSHIGVPMSMLAQAVAAGTAGTSETWDVRTLDPSAGGAIRAGDVLQADGELVRVTAVTAAVGNTPPKITVIRGVDGTPANVAHVLSTPLCSPQPVATTLSAALAATVLSPATITVASTTNTPVGTILRLDNELLLVNTVVSGTSLIVTRGHGYTTLAAHASGAVLFNVISKTYALTRGRTVGFDVNPWISAGTAPVGGTGWYWNGVPSWSPWRSFWNTVTPTPTTGGIQSRAWFNTWTAPPSVLPTTDNASAASVNSAFHTDSIANAATGSRYDDDQPAAWTSGTTYNKGDLAWGGGKVYTSLGTHLSAAGNQPGTGGTWDATQIWLKIERVPTTTRVRFLYAMSVTEPEATAWRPLLITPQTASAAVPRPGNAAIGDARTLEVDLASWFKPGRATLASALTATATSISLTVASGSFAIGDVIQVDDEYMRITAGAAPTFTVTRNWAQNLTAGVAHTAASEVHQARYRGDDLLIGLCAQSGGTTTLEVAASSARINTTAPPPLDQIDADDWEQSSGGTGPNDTTKYLASQYQVFWGPYDITEDFFFYGQGSASGRLATEDWIYNPREFWSQSRWWENGDEKDPSYVWPNNLTIASMRELLSKTTILSLNLGAIQDYLKVRHLSEAIADRIAGVGPAQMMYSSDYTLVDRVNRNGLLMHVSRFNRYPWNPNLKGVNPWNPSLPNSTSSGSTNADLAAVSNDPPAYTRNTQFQSIRSVMNIINSTNSITAPTWSDLVPYALGSNTVAGQLWRTPAIKPQDYQQAVRLTNAANINWGYAGGGEAYDVHGLSFFTPNQLFIQGDTNTVAHAVTFKGQPANKTNKLGIYCDTAIFLSNAWNDRNHQNSGLTLNASTGVVTGGGSLAMNQVAGNNLPVATPTTYQFALLTHTQPTNKDSVRLGEASSFISTMHFLEDWTSKDMTFIGSVVTMDTRRYTRSYLLDASKQQGLSPMGWMTTGGNPSNPLAWVNEYSPAGALRPANVAANRWPCSIFGVYGAPNRVLFYNPDFREGEGQPPLMPFGTKAAGMGGWSKVIR